jgi:hypothetical protein
VNPPTWKPSRFELVDEPYQCIIRDVENQLNFAFIAESGHGLHSHDRALAERVVQFLNRLLPMERTRP